MLTNEKNKFNCRDSKIISSFHVSTLGRGEFVRCLFFYMGPNSYGSKKLNRSNCIAKEDKNDQISNKGLIYHYLLNTTYFQNYIHSYVISKNN